MPTHVVVPVTHEERERVCRERYEAARALKCDTAAQLAEAIALLNAAIDARPTFVAALLLRATLLTRCGDVDAALTDLTVAAQLEEGHSVEQRRLAATHATRAALYVRLGKLSAALLDLRRACELEPDNGTWLYELGQVYLRQGNDACAQYYLQAALHDRVAARMSEAMRYKALLSLAMCRLHARELAQAAATLDKAAKLGDTATLHYLLGLTAYRMAASGCGGGSSSASTLQHRALDELRRATELDQRAVRYRAQLALCAYGVGAYTDALRDVTMALVLLQQQQQQQQEQHEAQRQQAQLLFVRAGVQLQLRMYAQALCDLDAAIALDAQPRYCYAKGMAYMLSLAAADDGSGNKNSNGSTSSSMAQAQRSSSQPSLAVATTTTTEAAATRDECATVYAAAMAAFVQALRMQPTLREAHVQLALLAQHMGNVHDALGHMQAALQRTSDSYTNAADDKDAEARTSVLTPLVMEHMGLLYSDLAYYSNAVRCLRSLQQQQQAMTTTTTTRTDDDEVVEKACVRRLAMMQLGSGDAYGALDTLDAHYTRDNGSSDHKATRRDGAEAQPRDAGEHGADAPATPTAVAAVAVAAASQAQREGDAEAQHVRAMALLQLRRSAAARVCAEAAVASKPDDYAYLLGRAAIHYDAGRMRDCLADAQSALRLLALQQEQHTLSTTATATLVCPAVLPPRHAAAVAEAHYLCARVHYECDDLVAALAALDAAALAAPALTHSDTYSYTRGVVLACAGRHRDALHCFHDAVMHCQPGSTTTLSRRRVPTVYHHERAKARQLCGDAAGAVADLDVVVSRQPRNVHALLRRALAHKQLQHYAAAARDWQCAARHDVTGLVAQLDSEDVFALPHIDLVAPGEEQEEDEDDGCGCGGADAAAYATVVM